MAMIQRKPRRFEVLLGNEDVRSHIPDTVTSQKLN